MKFKATNATNLKTKTRRISPKSFFILSLMLSSYVNILQLVLLMLYGFFLGILNICITKIRTSKLLLLP